MTQEPVLKKFETLLFVDIAKLLTHIIVLLFVVPILQLSTSAESIVGTCSSVEHLQDGFKRKRAEIIFLFLMCGLRLGMYKTVLKSSTSQHGIIKNFML